MLGLDWNIQEIYLMFLLSTREQVLMSTVQILIRAQLKEEKMNESWRNFSF